MLWYEKKITAVWKPSSWMNTWGLTVAYCLSGKIYFIVREYLPDWGLFQVCHWGWDEILIFGGPCNNWENTSKPEFQKCLWGVEAWCPVLCYQSIDYLLSAADALFRQNVWFIAFCFWSNFEEASFFMSLDLSGGTFETLHIIYYLLYSHIFLHQIKKDMVLKKKDVSTAKYKPEKSPRGG